jgi:hypothetical protein
MYDTGLMEELKDLVRRHEARAVERVGGFTDWTDRIIERVTRRPGRALWREMKAGARAPFEPGADGAAVVDLLLQAVASRRAPIAMHVAGHSTGAILLAWLIEALATRAPTLRLASCHLLAPAATVGLFRSHYWPMLTAPAGQFGVDRMTVYNLGGAAELRDQVAGIYRKSLLYLVSLAYEESTPAAILGMQIASREFESVLPAERLEFVYAGAGQRSEATGHGAFDNDPATLNDLLRGVLGRKPRVPFTAETLDY